MELFLILVLFFFLLIGFAWLLQKKMTLSDQRMQDTFKTLSFDIIEKNNQRFLEMAGLSLSKYTDEMRFEMESKRERIEASLAPVHDVIKRLDAQYQEMEKKREGAYSSLVTQIESLAVSERNLARETMQLSQSLRSPQTRGSWGQVHLRRVVELAGLLNHCDFFEQKTVEGVGSKLLRPDVVIQLPGQRQIVIDAKTPLNAYLDASDGGNEEIRRLKLIEHAGALRKHIRELSQKEYWKQFEIAPDYVILFLPAEAFFSAALQVDPGLIEVGIDQNIIVATPTTLVAILRAVAFSWKQDSFSKRAQEIANLGQEFYDRIGVVLDHWNSVGKHLNTSVEAYNRSLASLESRALVSARKLKELASIVKELPSIDPIDPIAGSIQPKIDASI